MKPLLIALHALLAPRRLRSIGLLALLCLWGPIAAVAEEPCRPPKPKEAYRDVLSKLDRRDARLPTAVVAEEPKISAMPQKLNRLNRLQQGTLQGGNVGPHRDVVGRLNRPHPRLSIAVFVEKPKILVMPEQRQQGGDVGAHRDVVGRLNRLHSKLKEAHRDVLGRLDRRHLSPKPDAVVAEKPETSAMTEKLKEAYRDDFARLIRRPPSLKPEGVLLDERGKVAPIPVGDGRLENQRAPLLSVKLAEVWQEHRTYFLLLGLAILSLLASFVGGKTRRIVCRYVVLEMLTLTLALAFCFWIVSTNFAFDWTEKDGPPVNELIGFAWLVVLLFVASVTSVYVATQAGFSDDFHLFVVGKIAAFIILVIVIKAPPGGVTTLVSIIFSLFWLMFVGTVTVIASPHIRKRIADQSNAEESKEGVGVATEEVRQALALALTRLRDRYKECAEAIEEIHPPDDFNSDLDAELGEQLTVNEIQEAERRLRNKMDRYRVHERVRSFYHAHATGETHFPYEEIEDDMRLIQDQPCSRSELATMESKLISIIERRVAESKRENEQPITVEYGGLGVGEVRVAIEQDVRAEYASLIGDYEDEIHRQSEFKFQNWKRNQTEKATDGSAVTI